MLACLIAFAVLLGLSLDAFAGSSETSGAPPPAVHPWTWPLQPVPEVAAYFEPPSTPYGPGHLGVDLLGRPGQPVLATAAGAVSFAGQVAGKPVVVVNHGSERSTYEPVVAGVRPGDQVIAGQPIGMLVLSAGHCLPGACLHLGRRLGETYLDPLELLGGGPVRLLPRSAPIPIPSEAPMPIPRSAPMPIPSEAPMLVPDPVEAPEVPDRPPPSPMPALTSPEAWTPGTAATLVSSVIVALRSGVEAAQSRG